MRDSHTLLLWNSKEELPDDSTAALYFNGIILTAQEALLPGFSSGNVLDGKKRKSLNGILE